ncbi:NADH-quinone oxidoreductase subunit J [Oscillatoria amoena NRMC-F 0135]|nr:NADH-quinone oxidoreductase subunit J [Oscillatoria amoena NRMC-F 0135]
METSALLFYSLSFVIILASLAAVTARRILRAAVYLLFALGGTAAIYFMVDYLFLAAVQLIVYAGGIVVLIIFSILLTTHINEKLEMPRWSKVIATYILVMIGFSITVYTITTHAYTMVPSPGVEATVGLIGIRMLSYGEGGYVLPFEIISILLLAALVGAIVIAKRNQAKK